MFKQNLKLLIFVFAFVFSSFILAQGSSSSRDLSRLSSSVNLQNMRIDSLDAQMRLLLPELQNALSANLKAKEQTDSVAILLINRINTFQNKMRLIEDKISYVDSVNFEFNSGFKSYSRINPFDNQTSWGYSFYSSIGSHNKSYIERKKMNDIISNERIFICISLVCFGLAWFFRFNLN